MKWFFILIVCGVFGFFLAPKYIDKSHNYIYPQSAHLKNFIPPQIHAQMFVADFHADTLLWNRDLLKQSDYGHVDVPRLIQGNVALQGFSIVTKTPRKMKPDHNTGDSDNITLLAIAERWPVETWMSLSERALFQANQFVRAVTNSNGKLRLIRDRVGLQAYIEERAKNPDMTAGFLTIEGSQALEGDLSKIEALYASGIRVVAPTHFFDTEYGASAHGLSHGGLTAEGTKWLRALEDKRMIIDLAHASEQTIADILEQAQRPVVVSHTGVRAVCDTNRNLSDTQLQKIAEKGGLIGIGFFSDATCGTNVDSIVRSIAHAAKVAGISRVALGSDFDGYVATPIDASQMGAITLGLQNAGFNDDSVRRIMGENLRDFLLKNLP